METVIIAVSLVTLIGALCAVVLSFASKVMAVKSDAKMEETVKTLPGTNCGACGFPGCQAYASALLSDTGTKINLCSPGGADVISKLSAILGREIEAGIKQAAFIRCGGDISSRQKKMEYHGIQSCAAAITLFGGETACTFGCLGYGDCRAVCPVNAVCLEDGLARVNLNDCTGCTLCVRSCPAGIIAMEKLPLKSFVMCNNYESGRIAREKCIKCCIGCGLCVKECPDHAISMAENLAKIDQEKCSGCGHCAEICPAKCIRSL